MASLFDSPEFNERLFFPRPDRSRTPDGAIDLDVPGDETLHVRWHRGPAGAPTLLLFHGNGEIVSDYDRSAREFAAAGVGLAVMDFRGYGRSTGTPTLRSALSDAARALEHVRARVATPLIVALFDHDRALHVISAVVHGLTCLLLFSLLRRLHLSRPAAGLAAMLMLVWPTHYEVVFWNTCNFTAVATA